MASYFHDLDLALIQKKILENPKAYLGAAAVSFIAITYALTRSSKNENDIEQTLPDYARTDMDIAFTQRFAKNQKRPHRSRRLKPQTSSSSSTFDEQKDTEHDRTSYSPFDPMNPSYNFHDADDEEYESEPEEGFSVDQYYVPFRVNKSRTKRKPDAPFMAMFSMYASSRKTVDQEHRNGVNGHHEMNGLNGHNGHNGHDMDHIDHMDDVAETDEENDNESKELSDQEEDLEENLMKADRGSSPPLESMIPSNHMAAAGNPLDNLKEKYYKQQLPQSLQPVQNGHVDPEAISLSNR